MATTLSHRQPGSADSETHSQLGSIGQPPKLRDGLVGPSAFSDTSVGLKKQDKPNGKLTIENAPYQTLSNGQMIPGESSGFYKLSEQQYDQLKSRHHKSWQQQTMAEMMRPSHDLHKVKLKDQRLMHQFSKYAFALTLKTKCSKRLKG